ncbi:MAG TPA: tetratricopeptide repeat protein [Chitinophagaceae bacterium]|nr:tetratricopeptide repeat protein [Chitinophagaceae bacterium]
MKRKHWALAGFGLVLLMSLYFFGQTIPPKKTQPQQSEANKESSDLSFDVILSASKQKLTPPQLERVQQLENSVVRGDVKAQQLKTYNQLATFWRDTARSFLPAAYYTAEAAKLENKEKNLTFAAHLFLDNLRAQAEPQLKRWMANNARQLFERVLEINAGNDSAKVGLGSSYMLGNIGSNPMEGILMIREVADRDPHNMYAQMMLGIGGVMTGQFDKAIDRFKKVVDHQPANIEAVLNLAEAYEQKGDKASAIQWYEKTKLLIRNPEIEKELDARINSLR